MSHPTLREQLEEIKNREINKVNEAILKIERAEEILRGFPHYHAMSDYHPDGPSHYLVYIPNCTVDNKKYVEGIFKETRYYKEEGSPETIRERVLEMDGNSIIHKANLLNKFFTSLLTRNYKD